MSISGFHPPDRQFKEQGKEGASSLESTSSKTGALAHRILKQMQSLVSFAPFPSLAPLPPKKEMLADLIPMDATFEDYIRQSLAEDLPLLEAKFADPGDHPYLLYIARNTQNGTKGWSPHSLGAMPINFAECKIAFERAGGLQIEGEASPLQITPEDYKIYIALLTKLYGQLAKMQEMHLSELKQKRRLDCKIYERELDTTVQVDRELRNLANFVGLEGTFRGADLSGDYEIYASIELMKSLEAIPSLSEEDREEFKNAFHGAATLDIMSEDAIRWIQEGHFCTIPVGYRMMTEGHAVNLIFYKNHFAICNRGSRINGTRVIEHYIYDPSRINSHLIHFLIFNRYMKMPSIHLAEVHQHLYLYTILPKILQGEKVEYGSTPPLRFKDQTVGNCIKASPLTAFKMGIYLKKIEEGKSPKEAAWIAKEMGNTLSLHLRTKMIQRAERLLTSSLITGEERKEVRVLIAKAQDKMPRKSYSRLEKLTIQDLFPLDSDEDRGHFMDVALSKPISIPPVQAKRDDPPLLLAIARQRKNGREGWSPKNLQEIPLHPGRCLEYFENIGGMQKEGEDEPLFIEAEDKKIFQMVEQEMQKYDLLKVQLMRE